MTARDAAMALVLAILAGALAGASCEAQRTARVAVQACRMGGTR